MAVFSRGRIVQKLPLTAAGRLLVTLDQRMKDKVERIWERTRGLRPVIEARRGEGAGHRLPGAIARAFTEANVYRLLLPEEFGGEDIDSVTYFDLVEEVAYYDGSAGWNYSIGSSTPIILGSLRPPGCARSWRVTTAVSPPQRRHPGARSWTAMVGIGLQGALPGRVASA
jgi:alkylation response protein AidB-like acyl-CoA dehydrogenase